ncbi:MAG: tetratricopeptide repeat protein [Dehalococcoidia bacterium]|nr:MAG: tetratricopeptide repeat protein [Dehalococcoidia bacterium]
MSYQEEEQAGLRRRRTKQAIALAMQGWWREAAVANKSLIESFPNDVNAYNRLGRAYMELGEYSRAEEAYSRAIELDPYNVIARRNLERLSHLGEAMVGLQGDSEKVEPQHFIEETGKAGVVNLYRLGPPAILAKMVAGDRVYLKIDGSSLVVENAHGEYLGQVEPKHGQRLIKLMEGGNKYTAAIISLTEGMVTVIVREVYQDPSQAGRLSFPAKEFKSPRPYISHRIIRRGLEEYEEAVGEEPGYTIVGGEEIELSPDMGNKANNEE